MTSSDFLLLTAVAVFVVTTVALALARILSNDADTRDADLCSTICLYLAAPMAVIVIPKMGVSMSILGFLGYTSHLEQRISKLLMEGTAGRMHPSGAKLSPIMGVLALLMTAIGSLASPPPSEPIQDLSSDDQDTIEAPITVLTSDTATVPPSAGEPRPKLTVRVLDKGGAPIPDAAVLLFDEAKILAGKQRRFGNVLRRTNAAGECDFGRLPHDHVAILVRRRADVFAESSVHLFTGKGGRRISPNRLVQMVHTGERIVVTHTMRQSIDLKFEVFDAVTKEPIHFAAIHWKDVEAKRWWHICLLDSGGQHNFTTLVPEMSSSLFRAARAGYEPVDFEFGRPLETGVSHTRKIELRPHAKVNLTILTPDGQPAAGAKIAWSNRSGLINEEILKSQATADGTLTVRYPPHPDAAQLHITHPRGSLQVAFADIGESGHIKLRESPAVDEDNAAWSKFKGRFVRTTGSGSQLAGLPDVVAWMWKPKSLPPEHASIHAKAEVSIKDCHRGGRCF